MGIPHKKKLTASLKASGVAIAAGDYCTAWDLLQNVLRVFTLVPDLQEIERPLLVRLVKQLERMKRNSDYDPLNAAIERARAMLRPPDAGNETADQGGDPESAAKQSTTTPLVYAHFPRDERGSR